MKKLLPLFSLLILPVPQLFADTVMFSTQSNASQAGHPIDVMATFTLLNNTLTVSVTNLENNPTSDAQGLADVTFNLNFPTSAGLTGTPAYSFSADQVDISGNGPGAFTVSNTTVPWVAVLPTGQKTTSIGLCDGPVPAPCNSLPSHSTPWNSGLLLGGPGGSGSTSAYSNADGSLLNNHQPFNYETETFTITDNALSGLTSANISNVQFYFGTNNSLVTNLSEAVATPEPAPFALLAGGLGLLVMRRRKK